MQCAQGPQWCNTCGGGGGLFRRGKFREGGFATLANPQATLPFARRKLRHLPSRRNYPTKLSPYEAPPPLVLGTGRLIEVERNF